MERKMDTESVNQRNEFFPHEVKNIVYRINKYSDSFYNTKFRKPRIPDTWAKCCMYSANKVNYRHAKLKLKFINPWKECERNCLYQIYKVKYDWIYRWNTRAYLVLFWVNISWKDEHFSDIERQFQATANREVTNLNDRAFAKYPKSRKKNLCSWTNTATKSRIDMNDIVSGKNQLKKDDNFQAVILKSQVDFRREIDSLWKMCWKMKAN